MQCPRCGATAQSAHYCPNCGARLHRPSKDVSTGGGAYVEGNVRSGRDFIGRDQTTIHDSSGLHALRHATGASRVLIMLGLLLSFVGFALFGYAVLDFMVQIFQLIESESFDPPNFSTLALWIPIGFGLMVVGIVLSNIGLLISRRKK